MPLKLILKPGEKVIVNQAVIVNGPGKSEMILQNRANVMREKDIMKEEDATTPATRVYFALQLSYLFPENKDYHDFNFTTFLNDFVKAVPSSKEITDKVLASFEKGDIYSALKDCKKLMDYEAEIFKDVGYKSA